MPGFIVKGEDYRNESLVLVLRSESCSMSWHYVLALGAAEEPYSTFGRQKERIHESDESHPVRGVSRCAEVPKH